MLSALSGLQGTPPSFSDDHCRLLPVTSGGPASGAAVRSAIDAWEAERRAERPESGPVLHVVSAAWPAGDAHQTEGGSDPLLLVSGDRSMEETLLYVSDEAPGPPPLPVSDEAPAPLPLPHPSVWIWMREGIPSHHGLLTMT